MSKAEQIVYGLLEMDPKKFILRQPAQRDPVVEQFRRESVAFITASDKDHDPADIQAIKEAGTFEEIQAVLAKYDYGNFLEFAEKHRR